MSSHQDDAFDRFSTWSIVLIAVTVVSQLIVNNGQGVLEKAFNARHPSASQSVSTDSFEKLIEIDNEVKIAYVDSWLQQSPMSALLSSSELKKSEGHSQFPLSDFHSAIEGSLDTSLNALRDHPDSIYFARRVILLRDLVSIPPLEGIPGNGKHLGLSSPLAAYAAAEKEEPGFAKQIIREQSFWTSVFSSDRIPPDQLHDRLDELNSFPTLLFYASIARQEICLRAGAYAQAKRLQDNLVRHSLVSTGALTALGLLVMMLFTLGAIIWIGFLSVVLKVPAQIEEDHAVILESTNVFDRFVVPIKERIPNKDRKLRAGDLLDCFAVYLLLLTGLGTVLGLLTQLIPHGQLMRISQLDLIYLNIGFALLSYLGASGLALLYLSYKAKKVGASLADELGLSSKGALKSIIYGALGWGASLVLLLGVGFVSQHLFHKLPAPENPALPMLSFAPNTVSRIALYSLAAVAAPFFEETFFRGVLLNALLLRFRPVYACLITGLMFGGIHPVGVAEALSLAALGMVFSWMAYLRKSLAPSMFAHFLQNSYAYFTVYLSFALIVQR